MLKHIHPHPLRLMHVLAALGLICVGMTSHATSFELQPSVTGQPFYRSPLPASVYNANVYNAAGVNSDWVVKNGAGEAVPFALIKPIAPVSQSFVKTRALSVFAIAQDDLSQQGTQLNVEFNNGKHSASTVKLQAKSASAQSPVVFLSKINTNLAKSEQIAQIQIKWRGAAGQMIGVEILSSNDLQSFQRVAQATLMNLKKADEVILQDTVVLDRPISPTYLQIRRVSPNGEAMSNGDFVITGLVSSDLVTEAGKPVNAALHSENLAAPTVTATEAHTFYDFQTRGRYDAQQLKLSLPQMNTITPITVFTRNAATQPWTQFSRGTAYRLIQNSAETTSPALSFAPHDATHWRIAVDKAGGGLGAGVPSLTLSWQAQVLVWNARGQGPFKLTVGEAQTSRSGISNIADLLPSYSQDKTSDILAQLPEATIGAVTQAPLPTAPKAVAKPVSEPTLRWWLWGGLGLGVLLLAAMAYSLIKQNDKASKN